MPMLPTQCICIEPDEQICCRKGKIQTFRKNYLDEKGNMFEYRHHDIVRAMLKSKGGFVKMDRTAGSLAWLVR